MNYDRAQLPITSQNVQSWFPAPNIENPFAGDPWWQVQSLGLLAAIQLLRLVPDTPARQQALVELRRALDTALLDLPAPLDEEVQRRLSQTLAPYVPSSFEVVDAMMELAGIVPMHDVLIDLGSGDGRVVLEACNRGAHGIGIEIDAALVAQARERKSENPNYETAEFRHGDIHDADLTGATIVTCYLLTSSMAALEPKLRALPAGTRIVSHAFAFHESWIPSRVQKVGENLLFLYIV